MTDPVPVDDGDRMIEIEPGCVAENAVQERQHLLVRIRSAPEKDDTRSGGIGDNYQARIVEVCRDHHSAFTPGHLEDLVIGRPGKPDRRRVNRVVARCPKVGHGLAGHRHVDEESQPVSSMVWSSARLAA